MRTLTGVTLAQDAGFITKGQGKIISRLISFITDEHGCSQRTALRVVVSRGEVRMSPSAKQYLRTVADVCED